MLYSSVSLEQCPKCHELFPALDLHSHHYECLGCLDLPATLPEKVDKKEEEREEESDKENEKVEEKKDVGLLHSSLSLEECPKCHELFPVLDLVSHHKDCVCCLELPVATCPVEHPIVEKPAPFPCHSPDNEYEECPSCSKIFTLEELVVHYQECSKRSPLEDGGGGIPPSAHIPSYPKDELLEVDGPGKSGADYTSKISDGGRSKSGAEGVDLDGVGAASVDNMLELEQCEQCLEEFPLYELLTHHAVCTERSKVREALKQSIAPL